MKKFLLGLGALLLTSSFAQAAVILHVEDVVMTQSLSSSQSGFFEVYLEETEGSQALVSTYNVGLRLSPTGVVTMTGVSAATTHPSLFLGQTPTDRTVNASGYIAGNDILLTDDFVISGNAADAPVQNGVRDGLFRIAFNVPQGAVGTFAINIDPNQLEIADSQANAIELTLDNGSITINPIPEPTSLALLAMGLPLVLRRRR